MGRGLENYNWDVVVSGGHWRIGDPRRGAKHLEARVSQILAARLVENKVRNVHTHPRFVQLLTTSCLEVGSWHASFIAGAGNHMP